MLSIAVAFNRKDADQFARWLQWVAELGGIPKHRLFVLPAQGCPMPDACGIPFTLLRDGYGIESDWSASNAPVRDASGPNSMFRQFAWYFHLNNLGPWMFCEPDCIPLVPDWADRLEAEYLKAGKRFMGSLVIAKAGEYEAHSTGNMIVPADAAVQCPGLMIPKKARIAGSQEVELAFDVAGARDVLHNYHNTLLIQHVFRGPEFETMEDLNRLRPEAVLWHSDKSGGLQKLLRERRSGKPAINVTPLPKEEFAERPMTDILPIQQSAPSKPRVFTYFSPCKGADALAEQERLLAFWREAWAANGWEPVVLTEEDAKKHPKFKEWSKALLAKPTINPKGYETACWLRWIAMAVTGGLLVDYDTLPFGFDGGVSTQTQGDVPTILCSGVPCAVSGAAYQYGNAVLCFIDCDPVIESGKLHLSDMHAIQGLDFPSLDICKEWLTKGWDTSKLVHFSHAACKPRLRSEVIAETLGKRKVDHANIDKWMTGVNKAVENYMNDKNPPTVAQCVAFLVEHGKKDGFAKGRIVKQLRAAGVIAATGKKK